MTFFQRIEEISLKFVWKHKVPQKANTILRKKKAGGIMHPDFKLFYKAIVVKNVWYWPKEQTYRSMKQNREPINKPMHIWSINLQQSSQEYTMGERTVFNTLCWKN